MLEACYNTLTLVLGLIIFTTRYICHDNSYDVIALSENHLSSEIIDDSEINIDDFTLFRKVSNRHGGGTALYCRSELNPILIPALTIEGTEIIWIQISINKSKILFGSCYMPPNQNAEERNLFLESLHSPFEIILDKIKTPFVLMGDFNDRCNNIWGKDHLNSELKFEPVNSVSHLRRSIDHVTQIDRLERSGAID